jgi:hypothetical protein
VMGFFDIGSHELFVWGWLRTATFLISASWVARITGMCHRHLAPSHKGSLNSNLQRVVVLYVAFCNSTSPHTWISCVTLHRWHYCFICRSTKVETAQMFTNRPTGKLLHIIDRNTK